MNKQAIKKVKVDKSRPCVVCGKVFIPKYGSSKNLNKYKTCSVECRNKAISINKTIYTEEQIKSVIDLKKQGIPNSEIEKITKVNINKIKEIVKKHSLFLPKEIAQKNAYESRLKKDPDSVLKMREKHMKFSQQEYENRVKLLVEEVRNGKGTITGLAYKYELNGNSVINTLKNWGGYEDVLSLYVSTGQKEICSFIEELGLKYTYNDRKIIPPQEIDIFIPEKSLGIEYCGVYWHSEESGKNRNYHLDKLKKCREKGIRLITIFEDEWIERKNQVCNFLKSVFNKNEIKKGARECSVKLISKEMAHIFYEQNHIQGATPKSILDMGLFFKEKLVGCMSFGPHHRQGNSNIVVLTRLAFTENTTISGGASKMFLFSLKNLKSMGYTKIVSWSDNRWSEGNVYKKLGFVLDGALPPDYSYVRKSSQKRFPKQSFKKRNLIKKGAVGNTELEMAKSLGYSRIYDCGKKRWVYNLQGPNL
jgi:hypothetical protein